MDLFYRVSPGRRRHLRLYIFFRCEVCFLRQSMSICSRSFRALSRSRLPPTITLTPFLYQTATIQQWKPATQPVTRRNASSDSRYEHDIPFENEVESQALDDAEPARNTTITGSERAAFEKLYKRFRPTRPSRRTPEHEIDQVADEYYQEEGENDADAASIDTLFDAVLSGRPQDANKNTTRTSKGKKPEDLASLAAEMLRPEVDAAKNKEKNAKVAKAAKIKHAQSVERARVKALLNAAHTDRELWMVLEREVFGVIKEMDLDGQGKQNDTAKSVQKYTGKQQRAADQSASTHQAPAEPPRFPTSSTDKPYNPPKAKRDLSSRDPRILFPNYPTHLVVAANILRANFPSSPLPLAIIPTLKSLGRSSYALGATTSLYKIMIRTAWQQQHSYDQICSLLQDMDNGGIEPDMGTLLVLDEILGEYRDGRRGKLGRGVQVVWGMQTFDESVKQLRAWRDVVSKRLGVWGETRVVRGEIVRKIGEGEGSRNVSELGPRDELVVRGQGRKSRGEDDDIPLVAGGIEDGEMDVPLVEAGVDGDSEALSGRISSVQDTSQSSERDASR